MLPNDPTEPMLSALWLEPIDSTLWLEPMLSRDRRERYDPRESWDEGWFTSVTLGRSCPVTGGLGPSG